MATEIEQIIKHIKDGHHFLLSGGAGSGKTYTLIQVIRWLIEEYPTALIACVTYTNAAVREIENRVNHDNLRVSTIHDFLWDSISNFQNELRETVLELIRSEAIKVSGVETKDVGDDFFVKEGELLDIQYKEYLRPAEGIISHDEVLLVVERMFEKYPKLREVIKGTYPFILVDEYQDTSPKVVKILLETIQEEGSARKCIIGFFGDAMQSIYDDGVGDIDAYKAPTGAVYEVKKEQNRRSPQAVIDLANKIRLDDLTQRPSDDVNAPNMKDGKIKKGRALFLYDNNPDESNLQMVIDWLKANEGWAFDDSGKVKELNLTHRLIAEKTGFQTLMAIHRGDEILKYRDRVKAYVKEHPMNTEGKTLGDVAKELLDGCTTDRERKKVKPTNSQQTYIDAHKLDYEYLMARSYDEVAKMYVDSDQLIDDKKQSEDEESKTGSKRLELVKHLMKIERCIYLYKTNEVADFLHNTEKEILTNGDLKTLHNDIEELVNVGDKTIGEIIELADEKGIVKKDDSLERYKERCGYVFDRVMKVPYTEVQHLYRYLEGMTPFSTQHRTKGAEFDNVLVIMDNGQWRLYNFERLFTATGKELEDNVVRRSRKIFYVCCTRAKENLAVYYNSPSDEVLKVAVEWFGNDNVKKLP